MHDVYREPDAGIPRNRKRIPHGRGPVARGCGILEQPVPGPFGIDKDMTRSQAGKDGWGREIRGLHHRRGVANGAGTGNGNIRIVIVAAADASEVIALVEQSLPERYAASFAIGIPSRSPPRLPRSGDSPRA